MAVVHGTNIDFKVPSLDLRFADRKDLIDTISGEDLITFARDSVGTYVDANGVIQSAATNEARFDHDPVTNESLGLLVEEARTNKLINSSTFSGGYTVSADANIIPYTAVAPDGTITASLLYPSVNTSNASISRTIGSVTSASYIVSVFAKSAGKDWVKLTNAQGNLSAWFNLNTGTAGTVTNENIAPYFTTSAIEDFGNGWYKCSVKSTVTYNFFGLSVVDGDNSSSVTANETNGVYVWGAQVEAGSFPTSYIPTPATFTSRASTATYYDASGVIQTAAIDEARDDAYFPDENGNFVSAGLLVEGSATNLVTYSESMNTSFTTGTQASWTTSAPSITAPDGSSTTTALNCQVGAVTRSYRAFSTTFNAVPHTFSVWLKFNIPTFDNNITLRYADVADAHVQAVSFNLSGNGSAGSGGKITPFSNGWYKCEFYFTPITGSEHVGLWFGFNAANTGASVYAWGAQLEESPYPTSYIPTTSSTVTRAADVSSSSTVTRSADVASITGTNFSSWYNQSEGSFVANVSSSSPDAETFLSTLRNDGVEIGDGFRIFSSQLYNRAIYYPPGTNNDFISYSPLEGVNKLAIAGSGSESSAYFNGIAGTVLSSRTPQGFTPDGIKFGSIQPPNGHISRLTYFPTRLSNSLLEKLTK